LRRLTARLLAPEAPAEPERQLDLLSWRPAPPPRPRIPKHAHVVGLDGATDDELAERDRLRAAVRTRADCIEGGVNAARPCPLVSCRFNTTLRVQPNSTILLNLPGYRGGSGRALNPRKVPGGRSGTTRLIELAATLAAERDPRWSCVLDVADRGEHNFAQIGAALHIDKERARQVLELEALPKIRKAIEAATQTTEEIE
jgi:hypothetical protein